jgi:succinylarginine dihydrolase
MLAGTAAVDIVRVLGFARTEERVVRRVLENARVIASNATSAVNVFVDRRTVDVVDVVDVCCSAVVVSDIRKRGSCQPGSASDLYTN